MMLGPSSSDSRHNIETVLQHDSDAAQFLNLLSVQSLLSKQDSLTELCLESDTDSLDSVVSHSLKEAKVYLIAIPHELRFEAIAQAIINVSQETVPIVDRHLDLIESFCSRCSGFPEETLDRLAAALLPVLVACRKYGRNNQTVELLDLIGWENAEKEAVFNVVKKDLQLVLRMDYHPGRIKDFFSTQLNCHLRPTLLADPDIAQASLRYLQSLEQMDISLREIKDDALALGQDEFALQADVSPLQQDLVRKSFMKMIAYTTGSEMDLSHDFSRVVVHALALEWCRPENNSIPVTTSTFLGAHKSLAEDSALNLLNSEFLFVIPDAIRFFGPLLDLYSDQSFRAEDAFYEAVKGLVERIPEDFANSCDLVAVLYRLLPEERKSQLRSLDSYKRVWNERLKELALELEQIPNGSLEKIEHEAKWLLLSEIADVLVIFNPGESELERIFSSNPELRGTYEQLKYRESRRKQAVKEIDQILGNLDPLSSSLLEPLGEIDSRMDRYLCGPAETKEIDIKGFLDSFREYHYYSRSETYDPSKLALALESLEAAFNSSDVLSSLEGVSYRSLRLCSAKIAAERISKSQGFQEPEVDQSILSIRAGLEQASTLFSFGDNEYALEICSKLLEEIGFRGEQAASLNVPPIVAEIFCMQGPIYEALGEPLKAAQAYYYAAFYWGDQEQEKEWCRSLFLQAGVLFLGEPELARVGIEPDYSRALEALEHAQRLHLELLMEIDIGADLTKGTFDFRDYQWMLPIYLGLARLKLGRDEEGGELIENTFDKMGEISGLVKVQSWDHQESRSRLEELRYFDTLMIVVCGTLLEHDEPILAARFSERYFELYLEEIESWSGSDTDELGIEVVKGSTEEFIASNLPKVLRRNIKYVWEIQSDYQRLENINKAEDLLRPIEGNDLVNEARSALEQMKSDFRGF